MAESDKRSSSRQSSLITCQPMPSPGVTSTAPEALFRTANLKEEFGVGEKRKEPVIPSWKFIAFIPANCDIPGALDSQHCIRAAVSAREGKATDESRTKERIATTGECIREYMCQY